MPDTPATVTVTLNGTVHTLEPTLTARKIVGRALSGYVPMFGALRDVNPDAMLACIVAGTGAKGRQIAKLEDALYATDLVGLTEPLVRFVGICAAGGRAPEADKRKPEAGHASSDSLETVP